MPDPKAIIRSEALRAGIPEEYLWVPLSISYGESGWNPAASGDNGASIGLFQIHDIHGLSKEYREDARKNAAYMMPAIAAALQDALNRGLTDVNLLTDVWFAAERPADTPGARANMKRAYDYVVGGGGGQMPDGQTGLTDPNTLLGGDEEPIFIQDTEIRLVDITPEGMKQYAFVRKSTGEILDLLPLMEPGDTLDTTLHAITGPDGTVISYYNPLSRKVYTPQMVEELQRTGTLAPPPPDPFDVFNEAKDRYDRQLNEKLITRQQYADLLDMEVKRAEEEYDRWEDMQNAAFDRAQVEEMQRQFQETEARLRAQEVARREEQIAELGLAKEQEETARGRIKAQDILPYYLPGATGMNVLGTQVSFPQINLDKYFGGGLEEIDLGAISMPGVSEPVSLPTRGEPPPMASYAAPPPMEFPTYPSLDDLLAQYSTQSTYSTPQEAERVGQGVLSGAGNVTSSVSQILDMLNRLGIGFY